MSGSAFAIPAALRARPPRLQGFHYRGRYRYSLTLRARSRGEPFVERNLVAQLLDDVQRTAAERSFRVWAHCFMTDHLHLLVEGISDDSDLLAFVKMVKQRCEHTARRAGTYPLWQPGYFERVLRASESPRDVVRYILDNPRRGGLKPHRWGAPYCGTNYP